MGNAPLAAKPDRSWILWTVAIGVPSALVVLFVLLVATFSFGVQAFGLRPYVKVGVDMSPTLQQGDRFVVETRTYEKHAPQRGDVIVFVREGTGNSVWAKRVIAVGGDTIRVANDKVTLNGKVLAEPYLAPVDASEPVPDPFGPVTVPPGSLFLLGDNRHNSNDSRYFGFVDVRNVRGRIIFIYWSKGSARSWTRVR